MAERGVGPRQAWVRLGESSMAQALGKVAYEMNLRTSFEWVNEEEKEVHGMLNEDYWDPICGNRKMLHVSMVVTRRQ